MSCGGVKVVADSVINHMSAGNGTGTGGSSYTKYNYPGSYSAPDFDNCTSQINDYRNRFNVQECELVGLADLDTGEDYVRGRIAGYLNDLLSLGVDGFRIDAAKHMAAADLADIKSRFSDPNVYWKHEAIHGRRRGGVPDRVPRQRRRPGVPLRTRPQARLQQREPRVPEELRRSLGPHALG